MIDANVVSEARKARRADRGVVRSFEDVAADSVPIDTPSVSVGELRRAVEAFRHRRDAGQASRLAAWRETIVTRFGARVLSFDLDAAQVWGRLKVPTPGHELDEQIAAVAPVSDLTVVTRNTAGCSSAGAKLLNPLTAQH